MSLIKTMINRTKLRSDKNNNHNINNNTNNNTNNNNEKLLYDKKSLLLLSRNDLCYICLSNNCQFISICCGNDQLKLLLIYNH